MSGHHPGKETDTGPREHRQTSKCPRRIHGVSIVFDLVVQESYLTRTAASGKRAAEDTQAAKDNAMGTPEKAKILSPVRNINTVQQATYSYMTSLGSLEEIQGPSHEGPSQHSRFHRRIVHTQRGYKSSRRVRGMVCRLDPMTQEIWRPL